MGILRSTFMSEIILLFIMGNPINRGQSMWNLEFTLAYTVGYINEVLIGKEPRRTTDVYDAEMFTDLRHVAIDPEPHVRSDHVYSDVIKMSTAQFRLYVFNK